MSTKRRTKRKASEGLENTRSKRARKSVVIEEKEPEVKKWRWGFLGSGKICQDFAHALSALPDAELVAVAARTSETAESFAKMHNIPRAYSSYADLAKDPEVDVVYIGTLHHLHRDHVMLCLSHGKHVLCEKSFTSNAAEAKECIELAKSKGVFLMEAMWTRCLPFMDKVREILASGELGEIKLVTANFGFSSTAEAAPRLFRADMCGGALLDVGIYPLSLASLVYGGAKPSKITAVAQRVPDDETGVDTHTAIQLMYGPGQLASLTCSVTVETPCEAWIVGTAGKLKLEGPSWHSTEKITLYKGKSVVTAKAARPKSFRLPLRKIKASFNFWNSQGLSYEAEEVHRCLAAGKTESDLMPLAETLTIMETMDEVRRQIGVVYPWEAAAAAAAASGLPPGTAPYIN